MTCSGSPGLPNRSSGITAPGARAAVAAAVGGTRSVAAGRRRGSAASEPRIGGVDIPQDLISLERAAEEQRARLAGLEGEEFEVQRRAWEEATRAVRAAIADHAAVSGRSADAVESAVKRAVRQAEEDPAG